MTLSNFIKNPNDSGDLVNLFFVRRLIKQEINGQYIIRIYYSNKDLYSNFIFNDITSRDNYFDRLEQYLILEI